MEVSLAIVGRGIGGLSLAYHAAQHVDAIAIIDPCPTRGASHVAAGMLAPGSEIEYGESNMAALLVDANGYYEQFVHNLASDPRAVLGYERRGTLLVAESEGDFKELLRLYDYHQRLGLRSTIWSTKEARGAIPGLSPRIAGALLTPDDHQVDPRLLTQAISQNLQDRGVMFFQREVIGSAHSGGQILLTLDDGSQIEAERVAHCTGSSNNSSGLPGANLEEFAHIGHLTHSVRGDILRLQGDRFFTRPPMTLRSRVNGRWSYLVTRDSGEIVLGATSEHTSYPSTPKAGSVLELLSDACSILPSLRDATISEILTGFRPGTADNFPLLGAVGSRGVFVLNGLYRHGFLLAPLLGKYLAEMMYDETMPPNYHEILDPMRVGLQ